MIGVTVHRLTFRPTYVRRFCLQYRLTVFGAPWAAPEMSSGMGTLDVFSSSHASVMCSVYCFIFSLNCTDRSENENIVDIPFMMDLNAATTLYLSVWSL